MQGGLEVRMDSRPQAVIITYVKRQGVGDMSKQP